MSVLKTSRFILIGFAALSAAGCVSVLPEAEPSIVYRLSSPDPAANYPDARITIRVDQPMAPRGLASDAIALSQNGQSIVYMANSRWIAPAPRLLQARIIETMNAVEPELAATRPEEGVRSTYELRLDLRQFEADYDNGADAAPLVRVRIGARLIAEDGRSLVASRVFSAQSRASENRAGAIIDAFDAASGESARALADWVAAKAERPLD